MKAYIVVSTGVQFKSLPTSFRGPAIFRQFEWGEQRSYRCAVNCEELSRHPCRFGRHSYDRGYLTPESSVSSCNVFAQ